MHTVQRIRMKLYFDSWNFINFNEKRLGWHVYVSLISKQQMLWKSVLSTRSLCTCPDSKSNSYRSNVIISLWRRHTFGNYVFKRLLWKIPNPLIVNQHFWYIQTSSTHIHFSLSHVKHFRLLCSVQCAYTLSWNRRVLCALITTSTFRGV